MAQARTRVKNTSGSPQPRDADLSDPVVIDLSEHAAQAQAQQGTMQVEHPDGSVTIDFSPRRRAKTPISSRKHFDNLADELDDGTLASIASEIVDGVQQDEQSRKAWLDVRARGIDLLAVKLEEPRGDVGSSSAPLEGMSTVRHPMLLEACCSFQAGALGELLPSAGPVKVRTDAVEPLSDNPAMTPQDVAPLDQLAESLQSEFNHYLTAVATEYYPDTDRLFFLVAFGGDGFKKVYPCPIKRRPVSESVDANDLIVSNSAVSLENCGRVTHRVKMRKSVLRRMQLLGAYRDIPLPAPNASTYKDEVDKKKEEITGQQTSMMRPQDGDYEFYESYVELDIDEFAPEQFKGKALPLPYVVTVDRESKQVLSIRRNWEEHDKECQSIRVFVQFPMIRGLGFYGWGFLQLLGNLTIALTAGTRELLDNGMFANFPGFLITKTANHTETNQLRVPPGGGRPVPVPAGMKIQDNVMPLPYRNAGPEFPAFLQHLEDTGKNLGMTANMQVGEGKQDAPVGTTLALIEQATKIIGACFKRLHTSQTQEFQLLRKLFQRDPEALWRFNPKPKAAWTKELVLQALEDYEVQPVADPNNPTSLHRYAKMALVKMLQSANPGIYDPVAVDKRILQMAGVPSQGLFNPNPQSTPPDPKMVMAQVKYQEAVMRAQTDAAQMQYDHYAAQLEQQGEDADRASREKLENMKIQLEQMKAASQHQLQQMKLYSDGIIHTQELQSEYHGRAHEAQQSQMDRDHEAQQGQIQMQHDAALAERQQQHDMVLGQQDHAHKERMGAADRQHEATMGAQDRTHQMFEGHQKRAFDADQKGRDRASKAAEGGRQRAHDAYEGQLDRNSEAQQKSLDRQSAERTKAHEPPKSGKK